MTEYRWINLGDGRQAYRAVHKHVPQRSDLPSPRIIRDTMDAPLWNPADDCYYDSKSAFREGTAKAGGIELGNDHLGVKPTQDKVSASDVGQAVQMLKEGYRPAVTETGSEGWHD